MILVSNDASKVLKVLESYGVVVIEQIITTYPEVKSGIQYRARLVRGEFSFSIDIATRSTASDAIIALYEEVKKTVMRDIRKFEFDD